MKTGLILALIALASYKLAELAGGVFPAANIPPLMCAVFAIIAAMAAITVSKGSVK